MNLEFHPVANIFPLLQGEERLNDLEVTGMDFEKRTYLRVWPSRYAGYFWIATIKDGLLETLESPVLQKYLLDTIRYLDVNLENARFWLQQYTGDGYNNFLHQPPATAKLDPEVYFIQAKMGGPVKIGVAYDIQDRLAQIQRMSPFPLVVLATVKGGYELETKLHQSFDYARLHGEWFEPVQELLDTIRRYRNE